MNKNITVAAMAFVGTTVLVGAAFANDPEPVQRIKDDNSAVHKVTDDNPAVGEKGKIMLYGVVLEKPPVSHRVNNPHDTRQTLEQTDPESS